MVKIMYARHTARLISLLWNCAVILLLGVIVLLSHLSEGVHATVGQLALLLCGANMAATLLAYALFCKFTAGSYHTFDGFFYRRYHRGEELLCTRWEDVYAMEYTKSACQNPKCIGRKIPLRPKSEGFLHYPPHPCVVKTCFFNTTAALAAISLAPQAQISLSSDNFTRRRRISLRFSETPHPCVVKFRFPCKNSLSRPPLHLCDKRSAFLRRALTKIPFSLWYNGAKRPIWPKRKRGQENGCSKL